MSLKRTSIEDKTFDIIVTVFAVIALLITIYPMYFVCIASISSPEAIVSGKVLFKPSGLSISAYQFIFEEPKIWVGYKNTLIYTITGTALSVAVTMMAGYALSRRNLKGRGGIMKIMVFTMFFSGGLVPTYMVVSDLKLINSPLVLIILGSVSVYNIIITRTYFQSTLPEELLEAAFMDGCGYLKFFLSVALPLSKPIIAVISLYYAVGQWNSFFTALIYITKERFFPLQLVLRAILVQGLTLTNTMDASELDSIVERQRIAEIIKYGVIIVSTLPVICAYPFLQKYFVKGVMIGSVKG